MPRPVMLGIVGDSGSGKTTITRGLVRVLGEDQITHFCTDDYHRYDRRQRAERNITPLHPDCNHLDILAQHLRHLRANEPIMKPVYQHTDGTFGAARLLRARPLPRHRGPARVLQPRALRHVRRARLPRPAGGPAPPLEGAARLLAPRLHDRPGARASSTGASPTPRRSSGRSATTPTSSSRSSRATSADQEHLDCKLTLRDSLPHPDLTGVVGGRRGRRRAHRAARRRAGALRPRPDHARARARRSRRRSGSGCTSRSHLREQRLGEFTIGTELHRSDSLAVVQLLILYHLVTRARSRRRRSRLCARARRLRARRAGREPPTI